MFKACLKIKILFKSGNSVTLKVESFNVNYNGDKVTSIAWQLTNGKLLYIDLSQIEFIQQI